MPNFLNDLLQRYVKDILRIYGKALHSVILYGSYARGDFRADSDIDILILVDLSDAEIHEKSRRLSDVTFDYNFDNDIAIMPIVKNVNHFQYWLPADPFYKNVKNDGVELYVA